jgi:hypothetical protein
LVDAVRNHVMSASKLHADDTPVPMLAPVTARRRLAAAIRNTLSRWRALHDGHLQFDNNAAERALRVVTLGRKNYLFGGSNAGGERAAAIYSLLGSAKLNGLDPETYLH